MKSENPHARDEQRWRELMVQAQAGARVPYVELLGELGVVIETYLRARFGPLDLLEDFVQECLLAVHHARHTYDPGRAFRPWMFTVVRHKAIDLLRRGNSRIQAAESFDDVRTDAGGTTEPEALVRLIDGVRVLDGLKPDHREVVTLTKYAGMTTAEAATWLGISESAVKARLHRGLRTIRRQLDAEGASA